MKSLIHLKEYFFRYSGKKILNFEYEIIDKFYHTLFKKY